MKKLLLPLLLLCSALSANAAWDNAAYIILTGNDTDAHRIYYVDIDGAVLGYNTLNTSTGYPYANSIVYGAAVAQVKDGTTKALGLFRGTGQTSNRYMNNYDDPLLTTKASGAELPRISANPSTLLNPALAADMIIALDTTNDGCIAALINRPAEGNNPDKSLIYRYLVPEGGANALSRDTTIGVNYWDLGAGYVSNFVMGDFLDSAAALAADQQIALLLSDGVTVDIRLAANDVLGVGANKSAFSFNVGVSGKSILDMWESDYHYLAVLYNDNTVVEYDANTGDVKGSYTFLDAGLLTDMRDVIRVSDLTIPEPAHYAALFGFSALIFAMYRRRTK